jgi:glycosyltransferase involved in cell wall biosynthesis
MAGARLLALSAVSPGRPLDGYALRVQKLLDELASEWSIALIAPRGEGELRGVAQWRPVPARPGDVRAIPLHDEYDARLCAEVRRAAADWRPDALLLWPSTEHVALAAPELPPALVDRIDCSTLMLWRDLRSANADGARRLASRLHDLACSARYERRVVRSVAATMVVGRDDARWLARIAGRPVDVVPNGVTLARAAQAGDEAPRPTVAFTGVLNYGPNVTAALFLARSIWPRVRARLPEAQLWIAGRNPTSEVMALAGRDGIQVCPAVPDMAALLRSAWLAAAPMQSGAGIKNKVLEAWAVGRVVVLSPLAANGLGLDAEASRWIATSAAEAAEKIVHLLSSPEERARAGAHARSVAALQHSWRDAALRISARLRELRAAPASSLPA